MRISWRSKNVPQEVAGEEVTFTTGGKPMQVQQLAPPQDPRVNAANLALALANFSQQFDMAKIMLDAERFLLFLTDDRIPEPTPDPVAEDAV